jgi:hypothetical protein
VGPSPTGLLRHSTIRVTADIYGPALPHRARAAAEVIDRVPGGTESNRQERAEAAATTTLCVSGEPSGDSPEYDRRAQATLPTFPAPDHTMQRALPWRQPVLVAQHGTLARQSACPGLRILELMAELRLGSAWLLPADVGADGGRPGCGGWCH